jgi:radical SAM-linked protein
MLLRTAHSKTGRMRFLGHLDLARTVHRGLARAAVPIAFTEGFNPQPRVAFGPPVALGVEALEEWVDLALVSPVEPSELLARLNAALCEGLAFHRAFELIGRQPSLGSLIRWGRYRVEPRRAEPVQPAAVEAVLAASRLELARRGKAAEKPREVRRFIRELSLDGPVLHALLATGSEGSLGILDLMCHLTGLEAPAVLSGYRLVRETLYSEIGGVPAELGAPPE